MRANRKLKEDVVIKNVLDYESQSKYNYNSSFNECTPEQQIQRLREELSILSHQMNKLNNIVTNLLFTERDEQGVPFIKRRVSDHRDQGFSPMRKDLLS